MAKIQPISEKLGQTVLGALRLPVDPGALNFGIAGVFAAVAGLAVYLAQTGWQLRPNLTP